MIYAIGDVHGHFDKLKVLISKIEEDAAQYPDETHKLIFLGDFVDRGPNSKRVIEHIMSGFYGFETIVLTGNHEQFMLGFLEAPSTGTAYDWFLNGGIETMESYGQKVSFDRKFTDRQLADLCDAVPGEHIRWLASLQFKHQEDGFLFVHAGIRPGVAIENQRREDLIGIRDQFLRSKTDHGPLVVHGHTPSKKPDIRPNRIGIDTGAGYGGPITCAVLRQGMAPRFISSE